MWIGNCGLEIGDWGLGHTNGSLSPQSPMGLSLARAQGSDFLICDEDVGDSKRIATRRVMPCGVSSRTTRPNLGRCGSDSRERPAVVRPVLSEPVSSRRSPTAGASPAVVRNAASSAPRLSIQAPTCLAARGRRYQNVNVPPACVLSRRWANRCGGCIIAVHAATVRENEMFRALAGYFYIIGRAAWGIEWSSAIFACEVSIQRSAISRKTSDGDQISHIACY